MTVSSPHVVKAATEPDDSARFAELTLRLRTIWKALQADRAYAHTSVVVPSLSVDQEELAKVAGAAYYEERLLFSLIRLRNPGARVIYLTSQPIHPDIIDYYLQLLIGVPAGHARRRLMLMSVQDSSPSPLTQKILERPLVVNRLRNWVGDPQRAYMTCYNATALERRLAVQLDIPMYGVDPELLWLGTKSGSRKMFREAGVALPDGHEDLHTREGIVDGLVAIRSRIPDLRRAVVKINEGFSGEGNALFSYADEWTGDAAVDRPAVDRALNGLRWSHADETLAGFLRKFDEMGGIVEELVESEHLLSPSVQLRAHPDGDVRVVSTHDQVLGSATGQVYLGGRFPANEAYRDLVQADALKIGNVLSDHGVIGRFAVDFLVAQQADGTWDCRAVEINLRMGGTTPPFMALEFLVQGEYDQGRGSYLSRSGAEKHYYATDNLKSPAYRGLLTEDLMDLVTRYGIRFDPSTETGVLFYMIGALSQYGKLGVVSIGNSREEADRLYEHTVGILDRETGADSTAEHLYPLFDHAPAAME